MLWNENTKFNGVLVLPHAPSIIYQVLPVRDTTDEVLRDIDCFFHRCRCHKGPRVDTHACLRYTKFKGIGVQLVEYIDNDRGARALSYKVEDTREEMQ